MCSTDIQTDIRSLEIVIHTVILVEEKNNIAPCLEEDEFESFFNRKILFEN